MVVLIDDLVNQWSTNLLRGGSLFDEVGLINPRPPSRAGSANSSRMCSPGGGCPVSVGMKCELIVFSRDSRACFDSLSSQSITLRQNSSRAYAHMRTMPCLYRTMYHGPRPSRSLNQQMLGSSRDGLSNEPANIAEHNRTSSRRQQRCTPHCRTKRNACLLHTRRDAEPLLGVYKNAL